MFDVRQTSRVIVQIGDGIWSTGRGGAVSYPSTGHQALGQVEDTSFWFQHRNACILAAVRRFPPTGAIFDVGGGNGVVSQALTRAGVEAVLVEPAAAGVTRAVDRGVRPIIVSTFEDACFEPASLPAVGLFDVLEHVEDDPGLLRSVRNALEPGGRLYLTVPAFQALWSTEDVWAGHHRRYGPGTVERVLGQTGFDVEFETCFFSALVAPVLLFRALPSRLGLARPRGPETAGRDHLCSTPRVSRLAGYGLAPELRAIRRGWRIPVGTSCLLVAKRPT